jgi:predicted amidohydrolase YtcJ
VDGTVAAFDEAAVDLAGASASVVDLAGRCVVPGFHDGHLHPLWGGTDLTAAPLKGAATVDDLLRRVRDYAAANPDLAWITGGGYPPDLLPNSFGDASVLDTAVADRPVLLMASDYHTGWANSAALAAAGIDADTPDPDRGHIVRRADGTPMGALLETAAELVQSFVPAKTSDERAAGLRAALAEMAAVGITWGQEAALDPADVAVYLAVAAAGGATSRINIALRADPGAWPTQRATFASAREQATTASGEPDGAQSGLVTVGTVKFFADGIIESGTAALLEPYVDAPHSCGLPNWDAGELAEAVAAFDADGFQIHIHAIGDAGVRNALDAVEHAARRNGRRDRRPVIAHTQLVHPDDLPRFAPLGVIANFEPLWAQLDPIMVELTEPRLGKERSTLQYPIGGLARTGATVSFGSDWPVTSMNPLEGMAVAMTRQTRGAVPPEGWLPEHRLALADALDAYTRAGAFQAFNEGETGTLAVGRRADLCVLGADLTDLPGLDVADVIVHRTFLGGVEVYSCHE